jgi:hypothetical protein
MNKLTEKQKQYIKRYVKCIKQVRDYQEELSQTLGLQPEGKLFNKMWLMEGLANDFLLELTDEYTIDWVNWFIWENDFGEKEMEAGEKGNLKPIKTLDDLFECINIDRI